MIRRDYCPSRHPWCVATNLRYFWGYSGRKHRNPVLRFDYLRCGYLQQRSLFSTCYRLHHILLHQQFLRPTNQSTSRCNSSDHLHRQFLNRHLQRLRDRPNPSNHPICTISNQLDRQLADGCELLVYHQVRYHHTYHHQLYRLLCHYLSGWHQYQQLCDC